MICSQQLQCLALVMATGAVLWAIPTAAQGAKVPAAPTSQPASAGITRAAFFASVEAEFTAMDANRDGRASKAEIEQHRAQAIAARLQVQNRALFARLDKNGDGSITAQEFASLAVGPKAVNVQPMIARMDTDQNQELTRAEYRSGAGADFDRLDTNKDGKLTPTEARARPRQQR